MAKTHKYENARVTIDSKLSAQEMLAVASQVAGLQSSIHIEGAGADYLEASVRSWAKLTLMRFKIQVEPTGTGTRLRCVITDFSTSQETLLYLIPVGPKVMNGYREYKTFMTHLISASKAADPDSRGLLSEMANA